MGAYLKTVLAATISVCLLLGILPKDENGKYANFAAGIFLFLVLFSPLKEMRQNIDFSIPETSLKQIPQTYIEDSFEEAVKARIEAEMKEKTGREIRVTVFADADETEKTVRILRVQLLPYTQEDASLLASMLGIEQEKVEKG